MAVSSFFFGCLFLLTLLGQISAIAPAAAPNCFDVVADDVDRIHFAMNLEFLEAELFLHGAHGVGLDAFDPTLAKGGPPPIGARMANLDPLTGQIIQEFGYQEIGHLRAIKRRVGGIPRPLLDLSAESFARFFDQAVGRHLIPPFDPYANSLNFLLVCYLVPYVGLVGYVGSLPNLEHYASRRLVASLLGVEAGQDAVIRTLLYPRAHEMVRPYNLTVAELTNDLSILNNILAMCGIKDEGIIVPPELGAENRTESNILSADPESLAYSRTPLEILRILYGTGNESQPGGLFPLGANGRIARQLLNNTGYS